jgi:hypothetical protein
VSNPLPKSRSEGALARKLAVVGNTCSGKTSLARRLAADLDVPHVELDALFWRPGWEMAPLDEFRAEVDAATQGEGWVADGNYFSRLGESVLDRADLVVWLDPSLLTIFWRLLRRTVGRIRSREAMWGTNRETVRGAFLSRNSLFVWALRMHVRWRGERGKMIARFPHVRLRSGREADAWLRRYADAAPVARATPPV